MFTALGEIFFIEKKNIYCTEYLSKWINIESRSESNHNNWIEIKNLYQRNNKI